MYSELLHSLSFSWSEVKQIRWHQNMRLPYILGFLLVNITVADVFWRFHARSSYQTLEAVIYLLEQTWCPGQTDSTSWKHSLDLHWALVETCNHFQNQVMALVHVVLSSLHVCQFLMWIVSVQDFTVHIRRDTSGIVENTDKVKTTDKTYWFNTGL